MPIPQLKCTEFLAPNLIINSMLILTYYQGTNLTFEKAQNQISFSIDFNNIQCIYFSGCTADFTLSGNGVCNDETNNPGCFYDGGDCCGYGVNTDHCSDCTCYHKKTCIAGTHPLVADGFCNDETNNADCNYDGGDCCVPPKGKLRHPIGQSQFNFN